MKIDKISSILFSSDITKVSKESSNLLHFISEDKMQIDSCQNETNNQATIPMPLDNTHAKDQNDTSESRVNQEESLEASENRETITANELSVKTPPPVKLAEVCLAFFKIINGRKRFESILFLSLIFFYF